MTSNVTPSVTYYICDVFYKNFEVEILILNGAGDRLFVKYFHNDIFFSREQTVSKICEDVGVAVWWFHCSLVVDSSRDGIHCQHCGNPRSIFIFHFY